MRKRDPRRGIACSDLDLDFGEDRAPPRLPSDPAASTVRHRLTGQIVARQPTSPGSLEVPQCGVYPWA